MLHRTPEDKIEPALLEDLQEGFEYSNYNHFHAQHSATASGRKPSHQQQSQGQHRKTIKDARTIASLFSKFIVLTILLIVCFALGFHISGVSSQPQGSTPSPVDPSDVLRALLISSFLKVLVLTHIILRSRWTGWKLAGTVFLAFHGSMTVIVQIESIVYLQIQLPPGLIPKLFVAGAIAAGLFSPISIMMLGKMRRPASVGDINTRLTMPANEWMWKLAAIAVSYLFLYYFFGSRLIPRRQLLEIRNKRIILSREIRRERSDHDFKTDRQVGMDELPVQ
jgi:hypothetical protein